MLKGILAKGADVRPGGSFTDARGLPIENMVKKTKNTMSERADKTLTFG